VVDAEALSRRAIEATATAYRLSKKPELSRVFDNAYPNSGDGASPKQWHPSKEYKKEFNTGTLFSERGEVWIYLRSIYDSFSAASSHAGPLATAFIQERNGVVEIQFIEADNSTVRLAWNYMLDAYWEMLGVFLQILRGSANQTAIVALEQGLAEWKEKAAYVLEQPDNVVRHHNTYAFRQGKPAGRSICCSHILLPELGARFYNRR
jgi:type II secretory pathway pseudopilin PulG